MILHHAIIELCLKLGYIKTSGVCHGISMRWLEACFLGEESLFDARIKRIEKIVSSGVDIVQMVNALKAKKGENLTQEDKELFDLLAFFDSLELYQAPQLHSELFNLPYISTQKNSTCNWYYASSDKIIAMDGLAQIYSEPMILTTEEITQYLNDLGIVLQTHGLPTDTFGVLLSSSDHVIALKYRPNVGWGFMDINQYPAQFYNLDEASAVKIIAEKIVAGLDFDKTGGPMAFNASVITTKNSTSLPKLTIPLEQFKASHLITKDIATREQNGINLAYIAAQYGHVSIITELAKLGADLNKADNEGRTPAIKAAQNGHVSVIAELAKHNADLNKADNGNLTPALYAAYSGYVSVIAELAKHNVNLDKANKNTITPAYLAAQQGFVSVLIELIKHKVDLNKAIIGGATPAYIAAKKGHASIIAVLAKHNVNLNKADKDGCTPAHFAAENGHASVITELAKHNVDLDKADNDGWTPTLFAAQNGHVSVLAELARHNVDLNKISSCTEKHTALHLAVKNGHIDCTLFLIKAGGSLMVKDSILKTPLYYTEIIKNQPMLELIKRTLKIEILDKLDTQIGAIKNKAEELKQRKFDTAYNKAWSLYKNLLEYKKQCSTNEIGYLQFKEQSLGAIKEARLDLGNHRGWKEILANILFCVLGLGVLYLGACLYKGSFFKLKTDSDKKLDDLEQYLEETASIGSSISAL
jgi:ankyrin repeat protein